MPADLEPGTPKWWLRKLGRELTERQKRTDRFDRYYRGDHELKFASTKFTAAFGKMFLDAADNWMPLVVNAVQERLRIEGFRLGSSTAGDRRAWRIWQENNLDSEADILHRESLINGMAATLTWPGDDGNPLITIEHPSQLIVSRSASNRRVRLAALKAWEDEDSERFLATLYLPDSIYKFQGPKLVSYSTSRSSGRGRISAWDAARWEPRELATEPWPLPNPFRRVPAVPIENQQRMLVEGESEIASVMPTQDRINKLSFDMMIAAEFSAFRQRWATGLTIPKDPETGEPVEPFKHAIDRLWTSGREGTKFGEFGETDLGNYVKAIELQVQHLAAQTKTPPHYLLGQSGAFPSGESLKATETGLINKVEDRQASYGEGWEETMRLALEVAGVRARGAASMETIWADAESRTESEHVDATLKKFALGVPLRQLWEDLGYSQTAIERFSSMLAEEAGLRAQLNAKAAPTTPTANESE